MKTGRPRKPLEVGAKFGRLTVEGEGDFRVESYSAVICECGTRKQVATASLRRGDVVSCGCQVGISNRALKSKHGNASPSNRSPEYEAWVSMRARCNSPTHDAYERYGGRGITVDPRWEDFEVFLSDVGRRPSSGHSLDRKDNEDGYHPGNVRWATRLEQQSNRRNTVRLTVNGTSRTLREWSNATGIPYSALKLRLSNGWTPEDVVSRPLRVTSRTRVAA